MNWEQVESEWPRARQIFRERWGKLSDNDLYVIAGNRDRLCGVLQQRYGQTRAIIEEFVSDFERRFDKAYSLQPPAPAPRGASEAGLPCTLRAHCDACKRLIYGSVPDTTCGITGITPSCALLAYGRDIRAHVAQLAAERDEALTWKERFSQAHAAGYAAAREEWINAIRSLPSPASPEPQSPKAQGTPKEEG